MQRIYQGWLFAGLAALGQSGVNMAYGQASAQSTAPVVAPTPQGVGSGVSPSTSPAGGPLSSPQGPRPPVAIPKPSPQIYKAITAAAQNPIPHPRSAESFRPGGQSVQAPAPSPQAGSYGHSYYPRQGARPSGQVPPTASPQSGPSVYGTFARPGASPSGQMAQSASPQAGPYTYGSYARSGAIPSWQTGAGRPGAAASPYTGIGGGTTAPGMGATGTTPETGTTPSTDTSGAGTAPSTGTPSTSGEPSSTGTPSTSGEPSSTATQPGGVTQPSTGTGTQPSTGAAATEGALAGLGGDAGAGAQGILTPNMIGDLSPLYSQPALASGHSPIKPPPPRGAALPYPTVRNFKASENQSPVPQDRFFFDFNYYNNVNSAINTADRTQVDHMKAYTYTWGFEKTFDQGNGSIGMRLPLNSLSASSINNAYSTPTSTALGNLDIFAKYVLKKNTETGSLITAGFQITPPTATSRFGGAPYVASLNTTYFQPFIAYLWKRDRFYLQGFSGFDFPSNNADVTLMYNDIAIGYFLYQDSDTRNFLTAIAPTFEVHLDSPFNHRNPYNQYDLAASPFVCNLTYGVNFLFTGRAMLTAALVTPVTSPKPFDTECALLFNVFFGRTVRSALPITPPVISQ